MTAPDPRLEEIEGRDGDLGGDICPDDCPSSECHAERDRRYLLAELRKAQGALGRVKGLCDAAAKRGIESGPPLELTALRAAVADATGGGDS